MSENTLEVTTEDMGGKPKPNGKKDKRLRENHEGDVEQEFTEEGVELADESLESETEALAATETTEETHSADTVYWEGVLVIEGSPTGDGREFASGAVTWAEPPLALQWQKETGHGSDHDVTVCVGSIDRVWRDGDQVMGAGVFDVGSEDGREARRRLAGGFLKGISIAPDDITDADIEYVWPQEGMSVEDDTGEDGGADDLIQLLFGRPEKVIFHAGRIRAATLVDIPAFVEAYVKLTDTPTEPSESMVAGGAVPAHTTTTSDTAWDAGRYEGRISKILGVTRASEGYALVNPGSVDSDGRVKRDDCRFLHHEVDETGALGPANLTGCSAVIGALQSGAEDLPVGTRRAVYDHVSQHLRAAGREPEPLATALLAAGTQSDEWRPPHAWFSDPRLNVYTPIVVTSDGRVYGHAAQWTQCHIGYASECLTPPHENDFPYFMTGALECDDGNTVAVGQITADIGHAPLSWSASRAAGHYDNTEFAVADVTVGNDRIGIWVAGAIRPWATERRVHALRASGQVSPDWRSVGGKLRMHALLTVNVSGYQAPRVQAHVAGGQVRALVASGMTSMQPGVPTEEEIERRALRLAQDVIARRIQRPAEVSAEAMRRAALTARVHGEG